MRARELAAALTEDNSLMCSRQAGGVRGAADAGRAHRALCQQRRQEGRRRAAAAQDLLRRQQARPGAHQGRERPGAGLSCTQSRHAGAYCHAITWTIKIAAPKQLLLDGVWGRSGQVMFPLPAVTSSVLPSALLYTVRPLSAWRGGRKRHVSPCSGYSVCVNAICSA